MNRPEERNALSSADIFEAFDEAFIRISNDLSIRAIVLTGAGTAFCSGGNVKQMYRKEGVAAGSPADIRATYKGGLLRLPRSLWELEVPVIAAVNGSAFGAGCDLALACDMRLASETASFCAIFAQLGMVPVDGGAWLLPRVVGPAKAAEMIFTGEAIDAHKALEIGLVSRVSPADDLLNDAQELARRRLR